MAEATTIRYSAPFSVVGPRGPRFGDYVGLSTTLRPPSAEGLPGRRHLEDFLRHKRLNRAYQQPARLPFSVPAGFYANLVVQEY